MTEIARDGARRMLAAALRAEADAFVAAHVEETLPGGRQRVVRHGYAPERSILTGIGALDVQRPKVRDRATDVPANQKVRFPDPSGHCARHRRTDLHQRKTCDAGLLCLSGATTTAPKEGKPNMDKDRIKGSAKQVDGTAKEALGKLSGDRKLEADGKIKKAEGTIQKALGKAKDSLRKW